MGNQSEQVQSNVQQILCSNQLLSCNSICLLSSYILFLNHTMSQLLKHYKGKRKICTLKPTRSPHLQGVMQLLSLPTKWLLRKRTGSGQFRQPSERQFQISRTSNVTSSCTLLSSTSAGVKNLSDQLYQDFQMEVFFLSLLDQTFIS